MSHPFAVGLAQHLVADEAVGPEVRDADFEIEHGGRGATRPTILLLYACCLHRLGNIHPERRLPQDGELLPVHRHLREVLHLTQVKHHPPTLLTFYTFHFTLYTLPIRRRSREVLDSSIAAFAPRHKLREHGLRGRVPSLREGNIPRARHLNRLRRVRGNHTLHAVGIAQLRRERFPCQHLAVAPFPFRLPERRVVGHPEPRPFAAIHFVRRAVVFVFDARDLVEPEGRIAPGETDAHIDVDCAVLDTVCKEFRHVDPVFVGDAAGRHLHAGEEAVLRLLDHERVLGLRSFSLLFRRHADIRLHEMRADALLTEHDERRSARLEVERDIGAPVLLAPHLRRTPLARDGVPDLGRPPGHAKRRLERRVNLVVLRHEIPVNVRRRVGRGRPPGGPHPPRRAR